MIGTVWRANKLKECLFLVVCVQTWYNRDGYTMLDLMSGNTAWGWESGGHLFTSSHTMTGSVQLENIELLSRFK